MIWTHLSDDRVSLSVGSFICIGQHITQLIHVSHYIYVRVSLSVGSFICIGQHITQLTHMSHYIHVAS